MDDSDVLIVVVAYQLDVTYGTIDSDVLFVVMAYRPPQHFKGNTFKMITQPAMLCVLETVPMASYLVKQLEVTCRRVHYGH